MTQERQKRRCGDCKACCTIMGVPSIGKVGGERCGQVCGAGCRIYDQRPAECAEFDCMWRLGVLPKDWRPDKVGVVFAPMPDGLMIAGHVDPARPNLWRRKILATMVMMARKGLLFAVGLNGKPVAIVDHLGVRERGD